MLGVDVDADTGVKLGRAALDTVIVGETDLVTTSDRTSSSRKEER
jgi:hypothetical protein